MKNFLQTGAVLPVLASVDYQSGALVVEGAMVGVAQGPASVGSLVETVRQGVFTLPKKAGVEISENQPVYVDEDRALSHEGVRLVGVAVSGAGADDTVFECLLDGVVREVVDPAEAPPE